MRSLVVGTAGHVDHGKSALVEALTGVHPDRLKEERERGITIDLGFAYLRLDDGWTVSFIDVPGHERFVRNMLAGVHGIDAVLLVVAADESVMPQTREHYHICRLLGVRRGLVALTKCDLASEEQQLRCEADVGALVTRSFLDGAEILRVSARSGQGLQELRQALVRLARATPTHPSGGLMRLPVDRVFSLKGFGTVATGTLVSGTIAVGEELEVMPAGRATRARGLQIHGASQERVQAGQRCAVNLASLDTGDLARGDVLTHPGTLRVSLRADVVLSLLPGARLQRQARVRVHCGSAEILARVMPVAARAEGEGAFAQLRFEQAVVLTRGDRLILRSYSPATTIGGAEVLDPDPVRGSVKSQASAGRLAALREADWQEALRLWIHEAGVRGVAEGVLAARVGVHPRALADQLRSAPDVIQIEGSPALYLARFALDRLREGALAALGEHHDRFPLQDGMAREELRHRLGRMLDARVLDAALDDLRAQGRVRAVEGRVALADHRVELASDESAVRARVLGEASAAGAKGVEAAQIVSALGLDAARARALLRLLVNGEWLERVAPDWYLHRDAYAAIVADLRRRVRPGAQVDVAGLKAATGLTRKHVIPLLEHLDRRRVTRRVGAGRILLEE
jgi:selenocysteine-specific elongation factor